jgi:hypothetical protein
VVRFDQSAAHLLVHHPLNRLAGLRDHLAVAAFDRAPQIVEASFHRRDTRRVIAACTATSTADALAAHPLTRVWQPVPVALCSSAGSTS